MKTVNVSGHLLPIEIPDHGACVVVVLNYGRVIVLPLDGLSVATHIITEDGMAAADFSISAHDAEKIGYSVHAIGGNKVDSHDGSYTHGTVTLGL